MRSPHRFLGLALPPAAAIAGALTGWDEKPTAFQWAMLGVLVLTLCSSSLTHVRTPQLPKKSTGKSGYLAVVGTL